MNTLSFFKRMLVLFVTPSLFIASVLSSVVYAIDKEEEKSLQIPQSIQTTIEEHGTARVIIGLKVNFKPEGELATQEDIVNQQSNIADVQAQFLDELNANLPASWSLEETLFETIPYVAIHVNQEVLMSIVNNPLVETVQLDEMSIPFSTINNMGTIQ